MADLKEVESHKTFGGWARRFSHTSKVCNCTMNFCVFVPAQAEHQKVPVRINVFVAIFSDLLTFFVL
jgi:S-formylglutathione hydrolase FrmB